MRIIALRILRLFIEGKPAYADARKPVLAGYQQALKVNWASRQIEARNWQREHPQMLNQAGGLASFVRAKEEVCGTPWAMRSAVLDPRLPFAFVCIRQVRKAKLVSEIAIDWSGKFRTFQKYRTSTLVVSPGVVQEAVTVKNPVPLELRRFNELEENTMMTTNSMTVAVAELLEKGTDADFVRETATTARHRRVSRLGARP